MTCCCCVWINKLFGPCRELPGACENKCCCYIWVKQLIAKCQAKCQETCRRDEALEHQNSTTKDEEEEPLVKETEEQLSEETKEEETLVGQIKDEEFSKEGKHPEIEEIYVSSPEQNLYILCTPCRELEQATTEQKHSENDEKETNETSGFVSPVHKFSEKELKDLRTCFEDADADGSGSIDKREMKKMLKKLGCYTTDKEFECLFREVDADGSGEIEFDEFLQGVRKLLSPPTDDDLVQKFKRLDQGGKGYLNFRDIKAGFQAMNHAISDRAINDMIAVASTDGDDQVSYEEFCAIAKRPRKI